MTERVLFVVPNLPFPLTSGGHHRDWQILNLLNRLGVQPDLLWFGAGERGALAGDDPVSVRCRSVTYGGDRAERPDRHLIATAVRKLRYLVQSEPSSHPFAYQYDAVDAGAQIRTAAVATGARVIVLRGFFCRFAPALRAAGFRVIANCPDANSRLAREMVRTVSQPLRKLGPVCNLVAVRRLERRHLPQCDEVWVPTESEAAELIAQGCAPARVLVVPNLLDIDANADLAAVEPEPATLLFVANFDYAPNRRAAEWLVHDILPRLQRGCPTVRLLLVGRGLPAALTAPGVEVAGFVPDLDAVYRRATVVVLPVREGAGTMVKTIEALARGKATVGTPTAFRGLTTSVPLPFVVAKDAPTFATATVELLADPAARRALAVRARAYAAARLSWHYGDECLRGSLLAA